MLNAGFVPMFGRRLRESPPEAAELYRAVRALLVTGTVVLAVLVHTHAAVAVGLIAPGLPGETLATAARLVQVMMLGAPFFVSGALAGCLALAHGHFAVVSLRSTVQNVGLLLGIATAVGTGDWIYLGIGFTVGAIAFAAWGALYVRRHDLLASPLRWRDARAYPKRAWPFVRVLSGLVWVPVCVQLGEVAERTATSYLGQTYLASTDFANFVVDTVVTLLAVPLGLAGLAHVSAAGGGAALVRDRIEKLTPIILAVGLPLSVVISVDAAHLVEIVYARGAFGRSSIDSTAVLLQGFAVGLWAQMLNFVYLKVYSARLRVGRQLLITVSAVVAGVLVMAAAVLLRAPALVGVAGSVTGLLSACLLARETIGAGRMLFWLARYLPGVVLSAGICLLGRGGGLLVAATAAVCALVFWAVYCLAVPAIRERLRVLPLVPMVLRWARI